MSVSKLWTNYSVKIGSGTYLDGVVDASLNTSLATQVEAADGEVFASFGSLVKGSPAGRFSSLDLKATLDAIGVTSTAIPGSGGATLFFRRMSQGGTRDAANAGTHVSALFNTGIMVPRRISARSGDAARIEAEFFAIQNGGTAPVTYSGTANLPANTPGTAAIWTVGKIVLNSTVLDGLESTDLDFGVNVLVESRDSDVYPTFASVRSQRPTIRVRGVHIDQLPGAAVTADGFYYTATQVVVYFRARAEGGTFVADGTASHIKFTLGKCRVEGQSIGGDPKVLDLLITPWLDTGGPNNPLAVNTASAIS